jgi:hypothetical protein
MRHNNRGAAIMSNILESPIKKAPREEGHAEDVV